MKARLNLNDVTRAALKPLFDLERHIERSGLERSLLHLLKIRASQINGCAYCIHMHTHEARADGETEDRLYLLDAWRESPLYSARERAALAWTEAVTRVADTHVPDAVYDEAQAEFDEAELVALTLAVVAINTWNRIAISFRQVHAVTPDGKAA